MNRLAKLTAIEGKLLLREPYMLITIVIPVLLLVILGSVPSFTVADPELGGARVIDLYVPIIIAMTLTLLALSALPTVLATYREKGILRRLSTTPLPPKTVLTAQLVLNLVMVVGMTVLLIVVARIAFAVPLPGNVLGFAVAFLLAVGAMFAIGLLLAAVAPSAKVASVLGNVLFYPVSFFAGLWFPRESMPPVLRTISDFTPLGAGVQAMRDATVGDWPQWTSATVLVAFAALAAAGAIRWFRWQ